VTYIRLFYSWVACTWESEFSLTNNEGGLFGRTISP